MGVSGVFRPILRGGRSQQRSPSSASERMLKGQIPGPQSGRGAGGQGCPLQGGRDRVSRLVPAWNTVSSHVHSTLFLQPSKDRLATH